MELTPGLGYKVAWTHSVLIGRKKSKTKILSFFPYNHAQRPANTASGLPRDPSDPLRWNGSLAAFLQQAPTALVAPEDSQFPRRNASYHHCDLILALLYSMMARLRRTITIRKNSPGLSRPSTDCDCRKTDEFVSASLTPPSCSRGFKRNLNAVHAFLRLILCPMGFSQRHAGSSQPVEGQ